MRAACCLLATVLLCSGALADVEKPASIADTLQLMADGFARLQGVKSARVDPENAQVDITLTSGDGLISYPDNLHRTLRGAANDAERQELLDEFLYRVTRATDYETDFDPEYLRVVIRHKDFGQIEGATVVSTPFLGELRVFYVLDQQNGLHYLTEERLAAEALAFSGVAARAHANMAPDGWALVPLEGGIGLLQFDGFYDSSLLLDPQVMGRLSQEYSVVAAVAIARDLILVSDAMVPGMLDRLAEIGEGMIADQAYPMSAQVMVWTGTGWRLP